MAQLSLFQDSFQVDNVEVEVVEQAKTSYDDVVEKYLVDYKSSLKDKKKFDKIQDVFLYFDVPNPFDFDCAYYNRFICLNDIDNYRIDYHSYVKRYFDNHFHACLTINDPNVEKYAYSTFGQETQVGKGSIDDPLFYVFINCVSDYNLNEFNVIFNFYNRIKSTREADIVENYLKDKMQQLVDDLKESAFYVYYRNNTYSCNGLDELKEKLDFIIEDKYPLSLESVCKNKIFYTTSNASSHIKNGFLFSDNLINKNFLLKILLVMLLGRILIILVMILKVLK